MSGDACAAIADFHAASSVGTSVGLAWTGDPGTTIVVSRKTYCGTDSYVVLANLPAGSSSYTDTTAESNWVYWYEITATDSANHSVSSAIDVWASNSGAPGGCPGGATPTPSDVSDADCTMPPSGDMSTGGTTTTGSGPSSLPAPPAQSTITQAYYVNCNLGSGGSGTASSPFGSLQQAQTAMQGSSVKTAIVSGKCTLTSNWNLTAADANETWEAACGQVTTISGGSCTVNMVPISDPSCSGIQPTTSGCYNITASGANNLSFYGFTFTDLAAQTVNQQWYDGLSLNSQSGGSIRWNTFENCTTSCAGGFYSSNLIIDSNTMNNITDGYPAGFDMDSTQVNDGLCFVPTAVGVSSYTSPANSANNRISNNLISNAQGGGISFFGNNTIITGNIIENAGQQLFDGGAVYATPSSTETGAQITNNTVINFGGAEASSNWTHALYLDDGVSGVIMTGNIVQTENGGSLLMIHGGDNNTINNNIWDISTGGTLEIQPDGDTNMSGNNFLNNIVYSSGSLAAAFGNLYYEASDALLIATDDIFYSASSPGSVPGGNGGANISSPSTVNPQFKSPGPGSYDYSIPSNSAAYGAGFKALTTNRGPSDNAVCPGGY